MGFISFVGRVLFASLFLLSAYQEYVPPYLPSDPCLLTAFPVYYCLNLFNHLFGRGGLFDLVPPIRVLVVWIESLALR